MAIEYELKYQATEDILKQILAEYGQNPCQYFQMETTYYDTPSGALSARHYTLRRRMENEQSVCTLKTPAEGNGRNEQEIACGSIEEAIPVFCQTGAPEDFAQLVQEGLIVVCGAKFHRTAITLQLEDCVLELALDKGILTGGGKEIPLCEVEVELKEGDTFSADLFATILSSQYGLTVQKRSKFRRALALYKGEIV